MGYDRLECGNSLGSKKSVYLKQKKAQGPLIS